MPGFLGWWSTAASALRVHGSRFAVARALAYVPAPFELGWRRCFRKAPEFELDGRRYRAAWYLYNRTWRNERAVELPIAFAELEGVDPERVLEIGNVLSWYRPTRHTVVDRYERGARILRLDVSDLDLGRDFDRIVSVSTLEHVGWDESPPDPARFDRAVAALRRHLAPGGSMLVTLPLGQNPGIRERVDRGTLGFTGTSFLMRLDRSGRWRQSEWSAVREARYDLPFPGANALVVARHAAAARVEDRGAHP